MRDGLIRLGVTIALVGAMATPALAGYGTVQCCLDASIDGAPPRHACIVLNVRSRRHPKARARQLCRLLGGRPRGWVAA
jgi:hypothetical protein